MAAAAGVPWVAVSRHLRRFFFGGLIEAAQNGSGALPGEDRLERAILEPAFLAVAAYRLEDETAAEDHPPQTMEELACEAEQTWEALERFPVDRRRQVVELLLPRRRSGALAVRACEASQKAAAGKPADALELAALALAVTAEQLAPTMPACGATPGLLAGPTLPTRAGYRRTSEACPRRARPRLAALALRGASGARQAPRVAPALSRIVPPAGAEAIPRGSGADRPGSGP